MHNGRLEDAKTFNKPDYRGFWTSITDKYKEKAHFVYELLQNADDARAKKVVFQLKPNCLVFRHNGSVRFSVSDVDDKEHKGHINSITGIGFSTKVQNINNNILQNCRYGTKNIVIKISSQITEYLLEGYTFESTHTNNAQNQEDGGGSGISIVFTNSPSLTFTFRNCIWRGNHCTQVRSR